MGEPNSKQTKLLHPKNKESIKPTTNLLKCLLNIKKYNNNDLSTITCITSDDQPRVNKSGDKLDAFVKDSLCNSYQITDANAKRKTYLANLSFLGSQNYSPDIMVRCGDAFEVKKVLSSNGSTIQLNSSAPKSLLLLTDSRVARECKECEEWNERQIFYSVGSLKENKLSSLFFIQGKCYACDSKTYKNIVDNIKSEIQALLKKLNLKYAEETNELGGIREIDPLGITDMRIRSMWVIDSPFKVYENIVKPIPGKCSIFALLEDSKYELFPKEDRDILEGEKGIRIEKKQIKDPCDPSKMLDVKLISFSF